LISTGRTKVRKRDSGYSKDQTNTKLSISVYAETIIAGGYQKVALRKE